MIYVLFSTASILLLFEKVKNFIAFCYNVNTFVYLFNVLNVQRKKKFHINKET